MGKSLRKALKTNPKLWGGRFRKKTDPQFERFSSSLKWDARLLPYDLKIDAAHVRALGRCGVLSGKETKKLLAAIDALERRRQSGSLKLDGRAEDVHSAIQMELEKLVGELAYKIHTGRSRNDLVSQSARLYCKEHARTLFSLLVQVQKEIAAKARGCVRVFVPGMTHLQNAQVVSQAHIFLAYVEMLERVKARIQGAMPFFDVCVLGSGALAGAAFPLNQKRMAKELGLSAIAGNSYDAAGDRDFVLNFLSCLLFLGIQLSRIAEDWMLRQLNGVSLIEVDQAFCTGSSMMPQKRNADFVELLRGAAGIFAGNFFGLVTTLKGLPTSYNRDLQWDKKYLFDSVEVGEEILRMTARVVRTLKINKARARMLLADESLYATDLADYLAKKGEPFKKAHDQVGEIVRFAEENGKPISKIGLDILRTFAPKIDGDVYGLFDPEHSVRMKKTQGSTHPHEVERQIKRWERNLNHASISL
ncbi:MAG: argininosuccinate lyase [Candidatus Omnitrophica bacterium]|nr:argininosuccinate lyase [Candidatus Omnitrophota bacterium]